MIKLKEVIIVEGRYDKNKIKQIFDAPVIETGGFAIFSDKEKIALIRRMAEIRGVLILTDSDRSGFAIRNFLKGSINNANIKHAYIPDIYGKEKRKTSPSHEGKLGVEGVGNDVIINAVKRAGVLPLQDTELPVNELTKSDLYEAGLCGQKDSALKRRHLLRKLGLPE
ncbi:MAG: DUF4093 domain-containing protein, partial [Clostridiales bacterium]|nr:DUF4093 domain-containing protein [Clostridiales bacterium]